MFGVFEELFFDCSGLHGLFECGIQIFNVEVQMHGCPMAVIVSNITCIRRRLGLFTLLQQLDCYVANP